MSKEERINALMNKLSTLSAAISFADVDEMREYLQDIDNLENCELALENLEQLVGI